jgi:hypothetical protein
MISLAKACQSIGCRFTTLLQRVSASLAKASQCRFLRAPSLCPRCSFLYFSPFVSGSQILSPLLLTLLCIVLHMVYPPYNYLLYGSEYNKYFP